MKTVKFNRLRYAKEFRKLHHSYEVKAYRYFKNALDEQKKAVIADIRANGIQGLKLYLPLLIKAEPMRRAYQKVYELIGVKHAEFTYKWIQSVAPKRKSISFFSEEWRRQMIEFYLTRSAQRIAQVDETTTEEIQKILAEAEEQGLTVQQTADYILQKLMDERFNEPRALRIARTESTTASNHGSQLAGESADYECAKVWIPVVDKNTRKSHIAMAQAPAVTLYDFFQIQKKKGGFDLMAYPGDPAGSAENCVNCRCAHAVVPVLDELGLPIPKRQPLRSGFAPAMV